MQGVHVRCACEVCMCGVYVYGLDMLQCALQTKGNISPLPSLSSTSGSQSPLPLPTITHDHTPSHLPTIATPYPP